MARQVGRTILTILNGNELLTSGPECEMDFMSALRKRNQCKDNLVHERQKQFLEIIRAKVDDGSGNAGDKTTSNQNASGIN